MHKVSALARALAGRVRTRAPYSVAAPAWPTGRGIDMSKAPGYELNEPVAPSPTVDAKMLAFAVQHGRLQASTFSHAPGYLWVGTVLTPAPRVYYITATPASSDVEMQGEDPALSNAPGPARQPAPKYVRPEYKRRRVATRRSKSKDGRPSRLQRRERERILDSDRGTEKE